MRLFRFLLIFLALSFVFVSCGADEDEEDVNGGNNNENNTSDNTGDENSSADADQNVNCGNSVTDDGEICDGGALECTSIDPGYTGGIATCKPDCSGWNTADCKGNGNSSSEDPTNPGNNENPGNNDNNPSGGFDKNSQGIWVDPKTYLIWENPMGNTGISGAGVAQKNAATYCENLVLAGADDWRLPTIDELRTLIRGVSTTMTDGKCPTSELCPNQDDCNKNNDGKKEYGYSCLGCNALDDPNKQEQSFLTEEDCLLSDRQIENGEIYIVPEMFGAPSRLWSSTQNTSAVASVMQAFWYVNYTNGFIGSDMSSNGTHWARCVRTGTADDVPEHEAEIELDPSVECIVEADCPEGKWCEKNKCVLKPAETYTAANGLEWQANRVPKAASWDGAKKYCEDLELAGKSDWRLPNIDELKSLVTGCDKTAACGITSECLSFTSCGGQQCKNNTCESGNYMPAEVGQQNDSYWTISEESVSTNNAWLVNFSNGSVFYQAKTSTSFYARCVRNAN